jgi:hypothetical protein
MIRLSITIILFIHAIGVCAQHQLMFQKNRYRVAYYKSGDVISFRVKSDPSKKITAQIKGFQDSLIVFQYVNINPAEITDLYVDKKTRIWFVFRYKYEKLFLYGGTGYLLLDVINTGELDKETVVISGSLITAGLLARWLIPKKIRIRGKRILRITDE